MQHQRIANIFYAGLKSEIVVRNEDKLDFLFHITNGRIDPHE